MNKYHNNNLKIEYKIIIQHNKIKIDIIEKNNNKQVDLLQMLLLS